MRDGPALQLLSMLRRIATLEFSASSALSDSWNGQGSGTVRIDCPVPTVVIFHESGSWQPGGQAPLAFSNTYRWSLQGQAIRLEHLRRGPEQPVYLLDLVMQSDTAWRCAAPHHCGDDRYELWMETPPGGYGLRMRWSIEGPRKREDIEYRYGFAPSPLNADTAPA